MASRSETEASAYGTEVALMVFNIAELNERELTGSSIGL